MKKYLLVFAACAFVFFGPQNGQAAIYNPVTEHWYALVDAHEGLWGNPDGDDNRFHWRSWTVAEANAVASGGHLVTIDDAAENAWLVSNFGSFVVGASYIGLYQETGSSEPDSGWLWLSLNTMNYTNWSEEEPNNALDVYGYENWGAMYLSASPADRIGRWFDVAYQSDKLDSEFLRYGLAEYTTNPVPIPGAVWMLGSGIVCLVCLRRKQKLLRLR